MRSHEEEQRQNRRIVSFLLTVVASLAVALVALVFLGVYALADLVF